MLRRIGTWVVGVVVMVLAVGLLAGNVDARSQGHTADLASDGPDQQGATRRAVLWLVQTHQNDDGGYTGFSTGANNSPSTVAGTLDAILAIAATGYSPAVAFPGKSTTPIGYLEANRNAAEDFAAVDGAQAGKLILALTAAGANPRDLAGLDAVSVLNAHLQPDGSYDVADVFKQSLAVLALVSAGEPVPTAAIDWIEDTQAADGSWDDGFGTLGNPDATSMAVMALLAAGASPNDPVVAAARDFLATAQLADGSWEYGSGFGGNANSTALVVQALSALGETWYDDAGAWTKGGTNPLEALLSFQGESGAFEADFGQGPFDDFFTTTQALPAVTGRPLPLPARFEAAQHALVCLDKLQDPKTGGWEQFAGVGVSAGGTARAIEAIRAAGDDPQSARWTTSKGVNAVEALEAQTPDYVAGGQGGRAGVVAQGVVAAGAPYNPASFAGLDLPAQIEGHLLPDGAYDSIAFGISAQAEAMLGLLTSGNPVAYSAVQLVQGAQTGGNWGDADQNGLALNVLGRLGARIPTGAVENLHATQLDSGGWGFFPDMNPSSSSEVVQGLVQLGQNPFGPTWSKVIDGRLTNAADAVMATQDPNGCWPNAFGPGDDPFSTTDAILLLAAQPAWDVSISHLPVITSAGS